MMADFTVTYVFVALGLTQVVLTLLAAFFAYRITRIVGVFWAWGLIVAAFAINAATSVESTLTLAYYPPDQLNALLSQFSPYQIWGGQLLNMTVGILLATGMYGLLRIFTRRKSSK